MTSPSTHIPIPAEQIDLWFANLDAASDEDSNLYELLSSDERDRAARLRVLADRRRFIASRGILRTLLGRYLQVAPQSIAFTYGAYGKPALSGHKLHFNLSHSHGRALFAFSSRSRLGVDIELLRILPDFSRIGENIFSPAEAKEFEAIPPQSRASCFFRCWTRKEALIKALGTGLSYPLDKFSVSFDEPARLLSAERDQRELSTLHLHHLEPEPEYLAAIATGQIEAPIALRHFR